MTVAEALVVPRRPKALNGLRMNSFAAVVMILLEFSLGIGVNLDATLPQADHGRTVFTAFGGAVTGGPVVLAVHALLGTVLLITGLSALARASLIRQPALILITVIAFLGIVAAWLSGARFDGTMANGASMAMVIATAVSVLCYALILFIVPRPTTQEGAT